MEKLKSIITSKKFWTLIAAIVAALAAYFGASCTGMVKIRRSGLHHDTVRIEQIYKSKNMSSWNSPVLSLILDSGRPMRSSSHCIKMLTTSTISPIVLSLFSASALMNRIPLPVMGWSPTLSTPYDVLSSDLNIINPMTCSQPVLNMFSGSQKRPFGILSLALVPLAVPLKKRRGGRRGRPRPRTKTVPLGGSHL